MSQAKRLVHDVAGAPKQRRRRREGLWVSSGFRVTYTEVGA